VHGPKSARRRFGCYSLSRNGIGKIS
jgi:hypothetical protein